MMRSAILMSSVAIAALTSPAFAGPGDRYDPYDGCAGSSRQCLQQQLTNADSNRSHPAREDVTTRSDAGGSAGSLSASRDEDDEDLGDEISNAADEAGDAIDDAFD